MREELTIVVCTYKRIDLLKNCIDSLITAMDFCEQHADILIIDNDPSGSAKEYFSNFDKRVRYYYCGKKNISSARNLGLSLCNTKWLACIDDDETVDVTWLNELIKHRSQNINAIIGPVLTEYPENTPNWVLDSKIFDRKRYKDGSKIQKGGAGNCLLDMEFIKQHDLQFDLSYGLSGGEDSKFFDSILKNNGLIIWSDTAIAREPLNLERTYYKYIFARAFRGGQTHYKIRISPGNFITNLRKFIEKIVEISLIILLFPLFLVIKKSLKIKVFIRLSAALGQIMGRFSKPLEMYK